MPRLIALVILLLTSQAHAEYRAYELVIKNVTTGTERIEISTLEPRQYRHYFPVRRDERVGYRQTWMCKGNTSHHTYVCVKPKQPAPPGTPGTPVDQADSTAVGPPSQPLD